MHRRVSVVRTESVRDASRLKDAPLEQLSKLLALGDRNALAELYRRYAGSALSVAMSVLHDRLEAEEVVQQTFLQVWQNATRYEPRLSSPGTWITGIAWARAVDALRVSSLRDATKRCFAAEPRFDVVQTALDCTRIRKALAALPAEQACVMKLTFYKGLSHIEVSEAIGVPLGTVKTRARLAMSKLAAALADEPRAPLAPAVGTSTDPRW